MQSRGDSMRASQSLWRPLMAANDNDAPLTAPALTATKPTTHVFDTSDMRLARFVFGGTRSAADNETINYQVIGWMRYRRPEISHGTFWMPRILAVGLITLGTQQFTAAGEDIGADVGVAPGYIADTITDARGLAGTVANSPGDNTIAMLDVAVAGSALMQLVTDRGTAATASAIFQLSDGLW